MEPNFLVSTQLPPPHYNNGFNNHHNHRPTHLNHNSSNYNNDHINRKSSGSSSKSNNLDSNQGDSHVHPHLHEHHQVLYPNNLAIHMMAVKLSWYKATRSVIEISAAIFLIMGSVIFLTGFLKLLWAQSALTSVQAGSYMIGSFLMISSATLGLIGAYQENWCLITSYACVQLTLFVIRTVTMMVVIKINYSPGFDDSFKTTKPFSDVPYLISGLPGTSELVPLELLYSVIEISLTVSAFYISYAINKASKEHVEHEHQAYVLPTSGTSASSAANINSLAPVGNYNVKDGVRSVKPLNSTSNVGQMSNMKRKPNILPVSYNYLSNPSSNVAAPSLNHVHSHRHHGRSDYIPPDNYNVHGYSYV